MAVVSGLVYLVIYRILRRGIHAPELLSFGVAMFINNCIDFILQSRVTFERRRTEFCSVLFSKFMGIALARVGINLLFINFLMVTTGMPGAIALGIDVILITPLSFPFTRKIFQP